MNLDLILLFTFLIAIAIFYFTHKHKFEIQGKVFALYRTSWGLVWMDRLAKKQTRLLKFLAYVGIVVGFPLNMNGSEGPRCQSTRQFVANFIALSDLPFCLWDERLSTVAVTRTLIAADLSRAQRHKVVDKVAASYILQGCLDALRRF